jgi:nucleoid DNA-binding protein
MHTRKDIMDELVKLVVKKTGISEEQARKAIDTVLQFIKQRLPAPLASQIDGLLSGSGGSDLIQGLGKMVKK